uniref:Ubiquitin-like protease family profile domain-containing protein n=1 Tax=Trichogramma kaykai TaxID=54128 RepID=A0ABD2X9L6_9HYME
MEEACPHFIQFVKLFGRSVQDKSHETIINDILENKDSNEIDIASVSSETNKNEDEDSRSITSEQEEPKKKTKDSLYYKSFLQLKKKIIRHSECDETVNEYYSEDLMKYFTEYLTVYFSLWSAGSIVQFGILRDSNASAENGFNILKNNVFKNQKRVTIPRFIQHNEPIIRGKIKEREFPLTTTRQKKNKFKKQPKEPVEFWRRKGKCGSRENRYFTQNKNVPEKNLNIEDSAIRLVNTKMNSDENQAMEEELDVNNATNLSDDVMINTVQNQIMKTYNELKKSVREIVKLESNNQKRNHWALLVVSLDQSIMMYLDSLHYSPPENLLKNVHLFMNYCTPKRQQKKISEKVWKYYRAIDIPKQVDDNCGVYVCAWALTLASSSNTAFGEADMNNIRKAIASFLYKAKTDGKSRKNKIFEEFVMHCVSLQET